MQKSMPLEVFLPGASVRFTDDAKPLLWAVDLVMAVTGHNRNYSGQILRSLKEDLFPREKITFRALPGKGNGKTPLVSVKDAIILIQVLPGIAAKSIRNKAADIIQRFFAGDETLVDEIRANATSDAPINALARASLSSNEAAATEDQVHIRHAISSSEAIGETPMVEEADKDPVVLNETLLIEWIKNAPANESPPLMICDQNLKETQTNTMGYVYAAWNPFFGDLIKIGYTSRSPYLRVEELSRTNVPEPFVLIASIAVYDPKDLEKRIHDKFKQVRRYGDSNEFFVMTKKSISDYFDQMTRETLSNSKRHREDVVDPPKREKTINKGLLDSKDTIIALLQENVKDKKMIISMLQSGATQAPS